MIFERIKVFSVLFHKTGKNIELLLHIRHLFRASSKGFFRQKALKPALIFASALLLSGPAQAAESPFSEASDGLTADHLWVLIAAVMVFLMQAGFKALEAGLVAPKHRDSTSAKNLVDYLIGSLAFFVLGYGLMFGESWNGLFGTGLFFTENLPGEGSVSGGLIFFLFQLGFATTSITIVSGSMAGRIGLMPYLVASGLLTLFIYPIFGHWVWGNLIIESNTAWLSDLGFIDFAGATVVHSLGAWVSLAGVMLIGPRLDRYTAEGKLRRINSNYSYSILGVILLWFGWWGFNGGSTLAFDKSVGLIILNTNLAAAAAGLSAFLHAYFVQKKKDLIDKLIGGLLTGLVAITACCHLVSPTSSILIGLLSGLIHNYSFDLLIKKWKLDDAVGVIPVHGIGGAFGTLCVALFGKTELLSLPRLEQFGVQLFGIIICFSVTFSVSYLMFRLLKSTIGLRVSPAQEMDGVLWGAKENPEITDNKKRSDEIEYISVKMSAEGFNVYSVKDFLAINVSERSNLIKQNRVQFWDKKGQSLSKTLGTTQLGEVVENERDTIRQEQQQVNDSLQYARRIQQAVEPTEERISQIFPECVVFNRPRDIVSGDFYWIKEKEQNVYLAVADCTGHGVPGAFLGMMGAAFLNEIVRPEFTPAEILNKLRRRVKKSLNPAGKETETKDGMDIALICYNREEKMLSYAGAYHPLYVMRQDAGTGLIGLTEIAGNRMPIGVYPRETDFTTTNFALQTGDLLVACSDGFADQIGGDNRQKFMRKRLKELLIRLYKLKPAAQKELLESTFLDWKGNLKQVDDVLVVGIRIV